MWNFLTNWEPVSFSRSTFNFKFNHKDLELGAEWSCDIRFLNGTTITDTVLRIFKYNQRDATLHNLFIPVKCSTCFRRFFRLSSGAQKLLIQQWVLCQALTATCHCRDGNPVPALPWQWQVAVKVWQSTLCCIYSFWAPDDGQKNRLKHVEHFTEINSVTLHLVGYTWKYVCDAWTHEHQTLLNIHDG